jgi:hypothetical protein
MAMKLPVGLKCPAFTPPHWPNTMSADTFKPLTSQNIYNFYMARRSLCQEINQRAEFAAPTGSGAPQGRPLQLPCRVLVSKA